MIQFDTEAMLNALRPEIRATVKDAVAAALEELNADQLLPAEQAAHLLGISVSSLRKRAQRGSIPCVRIGRVLRFRLGELITVARQSE